MSALAEATTSSSTSVLSVASMSSRTDSVSGSYRLRCRASSSLVISAKSHMDRILRLGDLGDDLLGELLHVFDLLRQRLCVGALDVRIAEADDRVGDAAVLEALAAVHVVGVHRDDVDLERLVLLALLLAHRVQPVQQLVEVLVGTAAVHPAVTTSHRTTQGRVGVPADQDRDRLGGCGRLGDRLDVVELAVELELTARGQAAQDVDALVEPLAAPLPRDAPDGIVLGPRRQ